MKPEKPQATEILHRLSEGDEAAASALMPLVYEKLHAMAGNYMRRERADHTLQPTALVHEAFLKLIHQGRAKIKDRAHFLAVSAEAMRRILVDHSRGQKAQKRKGEERITLSAVEPDDDVQEVSFVDLDTALQKLSRLHERQAKVVELRYFGGMTVEEVAVVLGVSPRTVKGEWRVARAWLQKELEQS